MLKNRQILSAAREAAEMSRGLGYPEPGCERERIAVLLRPEEGAELEVRRIGMGSYYPWAEEVASFKNRVSAKFAAGMIRRGLGEIAERRRED
ncbi:MAG: hypothetical protein N2320_06610 [Candidatus Bipolaricaulota bacterium]|nr:hypothetical protein [Candidatus Bipolaricaulota bacterium]